LIAYASAYLKCHYLAAFTAAILNNQPMGFYQPFTLVKDAQRHGLKVRPVDVTRSDWLCTIEEEAEGETWRHGDAGTRGCQEQFNIKQSQRDEMFIDKSVCDSFGAHLWAKELSRSYGASSSFLSSHSINISPLRDFSPKDFTDERDLTLRLGLRYVKGLREESGQAIVRARAQGPFLSIDDLHNRVPELRKDEMRKLAAVGALNFIQDSPKSKVQSPKSKKQEGSKSDPMFQTPVDGQTLDFGLWTLDKQKDIGRWTFDKGTNRRDALWQVERVARPAGELYEELHEMDGNSPLAPMTRPERMAADFRGTGLTIGRHPVAYHRAELDKLGACRAIDMQQMRDGSVVSVAGWVIVRQRPGTAKGFVFLTLEDETGVANVIITPQLFDKYRLVLVDHPFLLITGKLQNQDNVFSVKAKSVRALSFKVAAAPSHDFH
jgi:DNA polymerase III alpha subunit